MGPTKVKIKVKVEVKIKVNVKVRGAVKVSRFHAVRARVRVSSLVLN